MTLRHLRIFLSVCQEGSTTAAAEKLYIAQPTVSVAVRELERRYGVALFDRIGRRLILTEAGVQMQAYARHIVSLLDEMESRAQEWEEAGVLRLGSSIAIGAVQLPGIVARLQEQYPKLRIEVTVCNSDEVQEGILRGELDLGFAAAEKSAVTYSWRIFRWAGTSWYSCAVRSIPLQGALYLPEIWRASHSFSGRREARGETWWSPP